VRSQQHFLKTYAGRTLVGEPDHGDLVPPDDPDPPCAAQLT
jgi:hypothetical protein